VRHRCLPTLEGEQSVVALQSAAEFEPALYVHAYMHVCMVECYMTPFLEGGCRVKKKTLDGQKCDFGTLRLFSAYPCIPRVLGANQGTSKDPTLWAPFKVGHTTQTHKYKHTHARAKDIYMHMYLYMFLYTHIRVLCH